MFAFLVDAIAVLLVGRGVQTLVQLILLRQIHLPALLIRVRLQSDLATYVLWRFDLAQIFERWVLTMMDHFNLLIFNVKERLLRLRTSLIQLLQEERGITYDLLNRLLLNFNLLRWLLLLRVVRRHTRHIDLLPNLQIIRLFSNLLLLKNSLGAVSAVGPAFFVGVDQEVV